MEEATRPRNTLLIKELVTFSLDPPPLWLFIGVYQEYKEGPCRERFRGV